MNYTQEMISKAKTAASAAELLQMAKESSIEMTTAEAENCFSFLNGGKELSDDELIRIAGGKNDEVIHYDMTTIHY